MAQDAFANQPAKQERSIFGSLQEAYERLRVIVDSSYDGIYITDGKAVTLWVNKAY